jgi:hypothetical protein
MKTRQFAASLLLSGAVGLGAAGSPAFAHSAGAGKGNYGCTQNPNLAACKTPAGPVISGGSVTSVRPAGGPAGGSAGGSSAPQPAALPVTGGAAPAGQAVNLVGLLGAGLLSVLGYFVRRRAERPL